MQLVHTRRDVGTRFVTAVLHSVILTMSQGRPDTATLKYQYKQTTGNDWRQHFQGSAICEEYHHHRIDEQGTYIHHVLYIEMVN